MGINDDLNEKQQTAENEIKQKNEALMAKDNEINDKDAMIQKLSAEITNYEQIGTWIDVQMDESVDMQRLNALSIEKLKQWKQAIIEKQQMIDSMEYDEDEKDEKVCDDQDD